MQRGQRSADDAARSTQRGRRIPEEAFRTRPSGRGIPALEYLVLQVRVSWVGVGMSVRLGLVIVVGLGLTMSPKKSAHLCTDITSKRIEGPGWSDLVKFLIF